MRECQKFWLKTLSLTHTNERMGVNNTYVYYNLKCMSRALTIRHSSSSIQYHTSPYHNVEVLRAQVRSIFLCFVLFNRLLKRNSKWPKQDQLNAIRQFIICQTMRRIEKVNSSICKISKSSFLVLCLENLSVQRSVIQSTISFSKTKQFVWNYMESKKYWKLFVVMSVFRLKNSCTIFLSIHV